MKAINVVIEIIVIWFAVLLLFYCCSNNKSLIKGTIDIVDYYSEYADSVFNTKQHF